MQAARGRRRQRRRTGRGRAAREGFSSVTWDTSWGHRIVPRGEARGARALGKLAGSHGLLDLAIGLVLAERIHRPDCRGEPSDERDLQDEADNAGDRPSDREERKKRQKDGEKEAHEGSLCWL